MSEHEISKTDFDVLKSTWSNYGDKEVYWSVLTHPMYRSDNIEQNMDEFFLSGVENIEMLENIAQKNNNTLRNKTILDFGCGVGRLSLSVSKFAKFVLGIDISQGHIDCANKHKHLLSIKNVEFKLSSLNLERLGKFEIIISLIVLQHNRPELMKNFIFQLLNILVDNGVALLHIPFYIPNYRQTVIKNVMEMHFISENEIEEIAKQCNCSVLKYDTNMCGGNILNAIFYFTKH